jgi:DNA polymerase III gamma/tau subunit
MAQSSETHKLKTPIIDLTHPAHLWVGNQPDLIDQTISTLQQQLCPQNGCSDCAQCVQLQNKLHPSLLWFSPEKNYTREQLEPIFHTISFTLEPKQHFFFILEKADYLNQSCANSLLKVLEEPPLGYHFILLAQRIEYILPTIRSRCIVNHFGSSVESELHEIMQWFTTLEFPHPANFISTIDKTNLSERESLELLDKIFDFWSKKYSHAKNLNPSTDNKQIQKLLELLKDALEMPPMPGSSKLLWRNLFLQFTSR